MADNYELELIEEKAVAHVQAMALRLLDSKKMTRAALAERMEVSQAHVSQMLSDEPLNLSIKKAARLFHALDEELLFTCAGIEALDQAAVARNAHKCALLEAQKAFSWLGNDNSAEEYFDVPAREQVAA